VATVTLLCVVDVLAHGELSAFLDVLVGGYQYTHTITVLHVNQIIQHGEVGAAAVVRERLRLSIRHA